MSKSQWKDSGLNTGSNKGNACPSSYSTLICPHKNRAWHPFLTTTYILHIQMVTAPQESTIPEDCSYQSEQSLHWSPLLLLLTTDFRDTFHLFPSIAGAKMIKPSQTDQFKWDAKVINNREGSSYTVSIYSYSLAAVYWFSFTMKIIFLELIQG